MAITIGKKIISNTQLEYLKGAKANNNLERILEILNRVVSDGDITSGRENLHPDWRSIFLKFKSRLREVATPDIFSNIEKGLGNPLPYPPEIPELSVANLKVGFLLGAGASKPLPSDIPTVKELLPDLLSRAKKINREDLRRLAEFCEHSKIDNIEDLLTAAQLSDYCSQNPIVLRLVEYLLYRREDDREKFRFERQGRESFVDLSAVAFLKDTLQILFGLLSSRMLPAKPNAAHKAIAAFVNKKVGSSIVTTNYDCCMDLALGDANKNFNYLIDFSNLNGINKVINALPPLIKLHGSLNWFYCDTCQQVHLIDIKKTVHDYQNDSVPYSIIAICRSCGGQRRGLLVPPLAMKFDAAPPLTPLIEKAQNVFSSSDLLVIVGFSFADADVYISRMLVKAMQINKKMKMVIFDPDAAVAEKIKQQFSVRISNFDTNRILQVEGDCSKMLPKFLTGKFKKAEPLKEEKKLTESLTAANTKIKRNKKKKGFDR